MLQSNIFRDWLHKFNVEVFHCFRRLRISTLRKARVAWDLEKLWAGRANRDVTDRYAAQLQEDAEYRQEWLRKSALGSPWDHGNVVRLAAWRQPVVWPRHKDPTEL